MREHLLINGPVGAIETVIETPDGAPTGLALIAHPHPLHGGTMDNKVVTTLAKVALAHGLIAVRSNFRGVGQSQGTHDHGLGETDDLARVVQHLSARYPAWAWTLMGFSFGAFVQQQLSLRLPAQQVILVAPAVTMRPFASVSAPATIIHGDHDEIIPLAAVRDYATREAIDLVVIPAAGHFFHGKLIALRDQVSACINPSPPQPSP
ncbi:MAG: alpha/beta hydrolase [Betaproteobacteria bacterium]|nr:MAG: alpha/beta hydrolase [Betaproteobacteria bacterium]